MTDGSGGDEPPGHLNPRGAAGTASASRSVNETRWRLSGRG
jgi:hypothetical protein